MRFTALDSWRGLCALMVALYHLPVKAGVLDLAIVRNGYLYVDFFFVLSGFVICHSYASRIDSGASAMRFLLKRWGRIWPLHAVTLAVLVAFELVKLGAGHAGFWHGGAFLGGNTALAVLTNLALIQAWHIHDGIFWNFPSWSISTEWAAYLVFAATLVMARGRYMLATAAIGAGATALFLALSPDTVDSTYSWGVLRCISAFSLGVLIYPLHKHMRMSQPVATMLETGCLALFAISVSVAGSDAASHALPLVFAAIVLVFASDAGAVSGLFARPFARMLGERSYSLYLNHVPLILVIKVAAVAGTAALGTRFLSVDENHINFASPLLAYAAIIGFTAALIVLSGMTWRWIELPGQSWSARFANRYAPARPNPGFA